jgi:hypothetical protein
MQQWKWSKANERDLAKFVNKDSVKLLDRLGVHRFDLSHDPGGRRKLVKAIYDALVARNINYSYEQYQPEAETQIVRPPQEVLGNPGEGTCLDLATLFCGLCLGYELLPLLIIIEGHAFAAVSLNHSLQKWDDLFDKERNLFNTPKLFTGEESLAELKKLIDEEAYIAIECTGFAHTQSLNSSLQPEAKRRKSDGTLSFDNALSAGREQLENKDRSFKFAIDIAVAHYKWRIESFPIIDNTTKGNKKILLELELGDWWIKQNKYFSDSLKSKDVSRRVFKQVIDFQNENIIFIKRQILFDQLDNWYSSWNIDNKMFAVLGEEGDGKTWGVAYWLEQKIQRINSFPAIVFLPSISIINRDPLDIISEIVARTIEQLGESCKNNIKCWLDQPPEQNPILLLILDGIDEHQKFSLWLELINALSTSPWKEHVAVIITCRKEYWLSNAPSYLQPEIYNLPSYSEDELTEALQINHLNHSEIPKNLIPLISKPRYFDLMLKYRQRVAASGDITVQRLIYEDWKDRHNRKTTIPLNDDGFQSLIRALAEKYINKINTRKISEIDIDNIIPSMYDKLEIFNEIKSSGIIKGKNGLFEIDKNFLVHGFGLLLVEELEKALNQEDISLQEVIAQWLEPHAAMDIKGLICQAASFIALNDTAVPAQVKVNLIDAWINSQNPSRDMEKEFIAYLPLAPEVYIELAEIVWSAAIDNSWAQELLMSTFKDWLDNNRVLAMLAPTIKKWLGFTHRLGFATDRQHRQENEIRDEINQRIGHELQLGEFSFYGYQLTVIEDDGLMRLGRVALGLISLLPRPAFIQAITIGCLAEALMNFPSKYELFQWIILTSKEPVWNEIESEVKQLMSLENVSANRAAYRLLSFIGNLEANNIKQTFPDNLFPEHPFQEEMDSDPCDPFFGWSKDNYQLCLARNE